MDFTRIIDRKLEHIAEFTLDYDLLDVEGAGYSFPCDWLGHVAETDANHANLQACRQRTVNVGAPHITDLSRDVWIDAVYKCLHCSGYGGVRRDCGVVVCDSCNWHDGLVRCYCGWSASGRDGYRELIEMGEVIDPD